MTGAAGLGLRERKKRRTREQIASTAMKLFLSRGYEQTTVAEIAASAEVAPRTFFSYFPSKEDVVFPEHERLLAGFVERLGSRAPGEDALTAMREWILELDRERDLAGSASRERRRLIRETPSLQARDRANMAEFEVRLATAIAADLELPEDSLRPHLASAAAVAALDAVGRRADQRTGPREISTESLLAEALAFLQGGLEALRQSRGRSDGTP